MQILRSKPDDAATLTEIAFAAKRHWGYPENWICRWADVLTVTPGYIQSHPTFVALVDGKLVGFYALRFQTAEAQLDHLWVLPSSMRGGIGRTLFEHAERTAREAGAVNLKVESDPHAEGFYRRMGAVVYGQQAAPMDGQARFLPLLQKGL